jgi:hypothetical protein
MEPAQDAEKVGEMNKSFFFTISVIYVLFCTVHCNIIIKYKIIQYEKTNCTFTNLIF